MSERKSLNLLAYDHLRELIYSRKLQFNTIYSETKLAAELSISRTPMRDALNRLANERYIDILPNRGFMLHKPNEADVTEAYHVRMMIEVYCAEIIADNFPSERARRIISRMEDALEDQKLLIQNPDAYNLNQFWFDDIVFHRALLDYLEISSFNIQFDTFMHIFMPHHLIDDALISEKYEPVLERHRSTLLEHAAIIDALKSHDAQRTRMAIRRHLDASIYALHMQSALENSAAAQA